MGLNLKFCVLEPKKLQQTQVINAMETSWKKSVKEGNGNYIMLGM